MSASLLEQAHAVLSEAEATPSRALGRAAELARSARRQADFAAASVAERAHGIAALHVEDAPSAVRHLRASIALARRVGDAELISETARRLAATLNVAGRPRAALREIETLAAGLHGLERARALAQHGAILLQLDQLDAAYGSLSRAVPVLRAHDDRMWLKRAVANRGIVEARRLRFAAAHADLVDARRLNEELGIELSVAFVDQNLGWLETLRGDVPLALHHLDRAEATMRRLGAQVGFLLEDRARLLLAAGLLDEAQRTAEEAIAALQREGQRIAVPDVQLLLASIALQRADAATAEVQGRRAMTSLRRLGRRDAAAVAQLVTSAGRAAGPDRTRVSLAALERTADRLEEAGWFEAATQARVLLGEIAGERGDRVRAIEQLTRAARHRRRGPAGLRAAAWHAEAERRRLTGRPGAALSAARAGLGCLDRQRGALGAEELRVSAALHRVRLSQLGLSIALGSARPARVLTWAEHGRASSLALPPVRPPRNERQAADLAELRSVVMELEGAVRSGAAPTKLASRLAAVERRIRDHARQQPGTAGGGAPPAVSVARLTSRLDDAVLIEYAADEGQLHAVIIDCRGAAVRHVGATATADAHIRRLRFALRRAAGADDVDPSMRRLLDDAATRVEDCLLGPLADRLGDRSLVLVPTAPLQGLPWAALPSCRGRAVTVAPSASSWYRASESAARGARPPERIAVVAGPGLPGARDEATAVAALYGASPLLDPDSTVVRTTDALAAADVAHLAAHGTVHHEHALFSAVRLADGPLTGYDLARLPSVPRLVVLAGCSTGRDHVHPGDELLGLASTLLARGGRQVVATVAPVPDAPTAPVMVRFHHHLRRGSSTAEALAAAQAELTGSAHAAAAGFVCIGGTEPAC